MRRTMMSAALAAAMVLGFSAPTWADPPAPEPSAAWRMSGGSLTWTAPSTLPVGDAAVEFWSGDRLLGRATSRDLRTFTLPGAGPINTQDLQVRAAGRRLDLAPQRSTRSAPATVPARLPAHPVDPGVPGPFRTVAGEYDLPGIPLPGYPAPTEMRALVIAPTGAPGRRPLALFLHGRHQSCYTSDAATIEWPCPAGAQPVPSYRGYRQAQELLASQGYVTVSISANGVNGQDGWDEDGGAQNRSSLVRQHLDRWAEWAGAGRGGAPAIVRQAPVADLSEVFLVGHSRGGEGVNRAAMDSLRPPPAAQDGFHGRVRWTIRGTLLIGPTLFGHDPAPDVPSATILPGCDGDVFDLQGQQYIDATRGVSEGKALHSALYFVGANHNFFNTEWTPGQAASPTIDDWPAEIGDPVCTPGTPTRLTPAQQQTAGATYIAAAARVFVADDDRVLPLIDGGGVSAPSAGPAHVLSHALGGARSPVVIPDPAVRVAGARLCEQVNAEQPERACMPPTVLMTRTPHFVPFGAVPVEPGRWAIETGGRPATLRPRTPARVDGDELAMRIVVPPDATERFGVAVTDRQGRRVVLGDVTVAAPPSSDTLPSYWAPESRVPLKGVKSIAGLELTPRSSGGTAWLIDAWARRAGTPEPRQIALPRVDVGSLRVDEGDDGTRSFQVPVTVTGRGGGQVRIFVIDGRTQATRSFLATVRPGEQRVPVPIAVTANTQFGAQTWAVGAKAVRGLFVGDFVGQLVATDDDPAPELSIEPASATATEGGTLTWRLRLSRPADSDIFLVGQIVPPGDAPELSTTDVPADWLWLNSIEGEQPEPSRPLSATTTMPFAIVPAGQVTGDLKIPTLVDDLAEPAEQIRMNAQISGNDQDLATIPIEGRVTD